VWIGPGQPSIPGFGVVVDDVACRNPTHRFGAEVVDDLIPTVLAVQTDGARQTDVIWSDSGFLELVEDQGEHDLAVRRRLRAALDAVRKGDRDPRSRTDLAPDRITAEGCFERVFGRGDGVPQWRRLVGRVL